MKSNPTKMGDQEFRIIVCHGPNKYEISVCGINTVGELSQKVSKCIFSFPI